MADDLTGANASAAYYASSHGRAVSLAPSDPLDWRSRIASLVSDDVLALATDSRDISPESAASAVRSAVEAGWPADFVSKRIDSTLRGNLSSEIKASLEAVSQLTERRALGICMPAHPQAGRLIVRGMLVMPHAPAGGGHRHWRALPQRAASVDLLVQFTDLRYRHFPLGVISGDATALRSELLSAIDSGVDLVVADSATNEHLTEFARTVAACLRLRPEIFPVSIDCGPGGSALHDALFFQEAPSRPKVLAVSGSATDLTARQLQLLMRERRVDFVRPLWLSEGDSIMDERLTAEVVSRSLSSSADTEVVLLSTFLGARERREFSAVQRQQLADALGRTVALTVSYTTPAGVYLSGGDVASAALRALGGSGIQIGAQVEPLVAVGRFLDGPAENLPVATKGGLAGGPEAIVRCIDVLSGSATALSMSR